MRPALTEVQARTALARHQRRLAIDALLGGVGETAAAELSDVDAVPTDMGGLTDMDGTLVDSDAAVE